jgi:hypothetical protein
MGFFRVEVFGSGSALTVGEMTPMAAVISSASNAQFRGDMFIGAAPAIAVNIRSVPRAAD